MSILSTNHDEDVLNCETLRTLGDKLTLTIGFRDLSYESYYDPVGVKTLSSYEGEMDIESLGFRLVLSLL